MAIVNPFQNNRLQTEGLGRSLIGLGQTIGMQRQQEEQAELQAQKQQELLSVLESDDIMQQRNFIAANPQYAKQFQEAMGFQNEATRKNLVDSSMRILQGEDPYEVIRDRAAFVSQAGGNPADTLESLEDTPEEIRKAAQFTVAAYGTPQQAKAVQGLTGPSLAGAPSDIQVAEWYRTATPEQRAAFDQTKRGSKDPIEKQIADAEKLAAVRVKEAQTTAERKQGVSDLGLITKSAKESRKQINTINRLEKLNEKAFAGAGSEAALAIAKVGDQLGMNIEGLSESEQFQAIGNTLVLDKSQQMSGALSNADMQFLQNTVPNLGNTREGRAQMLDYAKRMQQREVEYSRAAQRFRKEKGYFNQAEFDAEYQRFADENPLFEGETPAAQATQFTEGQTATNPSTGQRMVYRGGQWQTL